MEKKSQVVNNALVGLQWKPIQPYPYLFTSI